jgi:hypothetical protein
MGEPVCKLRKDCTPNANKEIKITLAVRVPTVAQMQTRITYGYQGLSEGTRRVVRASALQTTSHPTNAGNRKKYGILKGEVGKLDRRRVTRGVWQLARFLSSSELEGIMADKTILVLVRPK